MILNFENFEKSLKEISKQIASIIAQECNKEYYWKGTTKE